MKKRKNIVLLISVCVVWLIIMCLIYVCSGCSIKPGTQTEPYPALTVRYGRIESKDNVWWVKPTVDRETTDLTGLCERDYPDTVRILTSKENTNLTIGKFTNIGYSVGDIVYIIREDFLHMWIEERYIVFIRGT